MTAGSTPLGPERPYQPPTSSRKDERFGRLGSDLAGVLVPGVGATGRTATAGTGGLPDPRQIKSPGCARIHQPPPDDPDTATGVAAAVVADECSRYQ